MATVVNERDVLIMGAPERVVDYNLPPNVIVPSIVGLSLTAPGEIFRVAVNGDVSPSAITMTVNLRGLPPETPITWQVTYGDLATDPTVSGLTYTLDESNMVSDVVTIEASVVVAGFTYRDAVSFARIQDGSIGLPGSRGSITAARAITGTGWSDLEAVEALRDYGLSEPVAAIAGDVVTLHNLSVRFVQTRRYSGSGWVLQAPSIPGTNILPGTVATESLLVTGMAEAMNADPNTQDITAWSGSGIQIVSDTTAPNGTSALQMQGQGVTVLGRQFPVNEEDNYQVRCWVKDHGGTGSTMFLLVAFYDASGVLIQGTAAPAGWDDTGTHHYYGLVNEAPSSSWVEHSVSFGSDEPFKVPLGARTARLGAISNFLSAGVQRVSGLLCRRKVDGRVVVEGSLAARHVDSRGLTIRNEQGQVLLEAGGDSTPPWVVSVDNRVEPGALTWASPVDAGNRSVVRGLLVDQATLQASYSGSGNSVVLSTPSTEVWRVFYSAGMPVYLADGVALLDHSQFSMEPNTAYMFRFDFAPRSESATPGQIRIYLELPAGARYHASNGVQSQSHVGGQVLLATEDAPILAPGPFDCITHEVVVVSPAEGGLMRLRAEAVSQNCSLAWGTRFQGWRVKGYKLPQLVTPTAAVIRDLGAVRPASNSGFSLGSSTPYDAIQVVNVMSSSILAGAIPSVSVQREALTSNVVFLAMAQSISSQAVSSGRTMQDHNSLLGGTIRAVMHMSELLANIPPSESSRWAFRFRRVSLSHPSALPDLNYMMQIDESRPVELNIPAPPTPHSLSCSGPPEDLYIYPALEDGSGQAVGFGPFVIDYHIQAYFMGQEFGPEQTFRLVINFA